MLNASWSLVFCLGACPPNKYILLLLFFRRMVLLQRSSWWSIKISKWQEVNMHEWKYLFKHDRLVGSENILLSGFELTGRNLRADFWHLRIENCIFLRIEMF